MPRSGSECDLRTLHVNPPVIIEESVVHPELTAVDGIVLKADAGTALHIDPRPVSAIVKADDKAVAHRNVREVLRLKTHPQQALGPVQLGDALDEVDRPSLQPPLLRLDREANWAPRLLLLELLTEFDRVGVAFVNLQQKCAFLRCDLDDVALGETQRVAIEDEAAHGDVRAIQDAEKLIPRIADDLRAVAFNGDARGPIEGQDGAVWLTGETIALLLKHHRRPRPRFDRRSQCLAHRRGVIGLAVADRTVVSNLEIGGVEKRRTEQC